MSREIKFRVWDWKEYTYSDKLYYNGIESHSEVYQNFSKIGFLFYSKAEIAEKCIIQQFTGLKDKNGKEIYEGDIVEGSGDTTFSKGRYEITFGSYGIGFRRKLKNGNYSTSTILEYNIIGNIFENPELLN